MKNAKNLQKFYTGTKKKYTIFFHIFFQTFLHIFLHISVLNCNWCKIRPGLDIVLLQLSKFLKWNMVGFFFKNPANVWTGHPPHTIKGQVDDSGKSSAKLGQDNFLAS